MLPFPPSQGGGWRTGARSGGSLEELQQFHNCFPFFCSLNCFPRSAVLSERASSPRPRRRTGPFPSPAGVDTPQCEGELRTATYGELFVIIAFANERTNEAATASAARKNPSPPPPSLSLSLSHSLSLSSSAASSRERVAALVRLRSGFFSSLEHRLLYYLCPGAVITA
jgi:hypothetical protein